MQRGPETAVLRAWLDRERSGRGGDGDADGRGEDDGSPGENDDDPEIDPVPAETRRDRLLAALLEAKPGAAAVLWGDRPIDWYRTTLSRAALRELRLVEGPPRLGWRALSPDGTVRGAAERVAEGSPDRLERETGVDVDAVLAYRSAVADGESVGRLVVTTRRGRTPWHVADGNHRAVARALYLLETGRYDPQPIHLGVTANPVLRPVLQHLGGLVDRVQGRSDRR